METKKKDYGASVGREGGVVWGGHTNLTKNEQSITKKIKIIEFSFSVGRIPSPS